MIRPLFALCLACLLGGCATRDDGPDRRGDPVREAEMRRRDLHRRVDARVDEVTDRLRDDLHRMVDEAFEAGRTSAVRDGGDRGFRGDAPMPTPRDGRRPEPSAPRRTRRADIPPREGGDDVRVIEIAPSDSGSGEDPLDFDRMLERAKREAGFDRPTIVIEPAPESRPGSSEPRGGPRVRRLESFTESRPTPRRRVQ